MLAPSGRDTAAEKVRTALENVYRHRDKLTKDIGGKAGTSEFADAVIEAMETPEAAQTPAEPSRAQ